MICPQQVIDSLGANKAIYNKISNRIIGCTPDPYTSQLIQVGKIKIYACMFAHVGGERFKETQHIAFFISGKDKSIFHSADIDPFQTDMYTGIKISKLNVELGWINEDFAKTENAGFARVFINAKQIRR